MQSAKLILIVNLDKIYFYILQELICKKKNKCIFICGTIDISIYQILYTEWHTFGNFVFQYEFDHSNYSFSPRSGIHYVYSFNSRAVATLWKDKEYR